MLNFKDVSFSYGEKDILTGFNLDCAPGTISCLLGPSGSGKSTTIKLIEKLIKTQKGSIEFKGKNINDWDDLELRRSIGYVIQQIGLFPHLSVAENILLPLINSELSSEEKRERARELLKQMELDPDIFSNRYPRELSGGQSQRIGVARAMITKPDLILMDEPFGALDPLIRAELQNKLLELRDSNKTTILFIGHDIAECFKIGDQILILNNGKIEGQGSPKVLKNQTESTFVKKFIDAQIYS